MKLLFEKQQTFANLWLELMLGNYTRNRSINPWPTVFIRNGISIHRKVDSHLDKIRPVASKKWFCPILNGQKQIAKLRAYIKQLDRRKMTASVLMAFFLIATLRSKHWAASNTFVFVKNCDRLSLKKVFNVRVKRENLMG